MKNNTDMAKIHYNMLPGCFSAHGFLGEDTRNLTDILEEDDLLVKSMGLSHKAIADRMHYFTQNGKKGLGSPVLVDDSYEVIVEEFRGFIPCPFSDSFHACKQNTQVKNIKTNVCISWTDLNIHMIRMHGFYEGKGCFFRINPEELSNVLGLLSS